MNTGFAMRSDRRDFDAAVLITRTWSRKLEWHAMLGQNPEAEASVVLVRPSTTAWAGW
ncbi:MAG: hypothetical protein WA700_16840 [Acidobacteriaceae bacterium]